MQVVFVEKYRWLVSVRVEQVRHHDIVIEVSADSESEAIAASLAYRVPDDFVEGTASDLVSSYTVDATVLQEVYELDPYVIRIAAVQDGDIR